MSTPTCIDLLHLGLPGAIGVYVLDADEPTLVDPGPTTTFERLSAELEAMGIGPGDLRHVLLTHVHLDHAGSTGHLVSRYPRATVHVHRDGAPHMVDPERLVASTRRTFGDAHDGLWGEVRPVPAERIRAWEPGEPGAWRGLRPLSTPGHIGHHVAYLDERDGTLLSGDSMGIVLADDAPTHPPTPPPAVDLRAWERTLAELRGIGAERFGPTHFGLHADVASRAAHLQERLHALEARVEAAVDRGDEADAEAYDREVREELAPAVGADRVERYFDMFTAANDWAGVAFYLKRNPREGRR